MKRVHVDGWTSKCGQPVMGKNPDVQRAEKKAEGLEHGGWVVRAVRVRMKRWAGAGPQRDLLSLRLLALTEALSESGPACVGAGGGGEVGASHGRGVMREGEVPGKGHLLSPESRKSQGAHAERL